MCILYSLWNYIPGRWSLEIKCGPFLCECWALGLLTLKNTKTILCFTIDNWQFNISILHKLYSFWLIIIISQKFSSSDFYTAEYIFVDKQAPEYRNCNEARPGILTFKWSTAFVVIWLHILRSRCVRLWQYRASSRTLLSVMLSHFEASSDTSLWRWSATDDKPVSVIEVHPLNVNCSRVWSLSATSVSALSVIFNKRN